MKKTLITLSLCVVSLLLTTSCGERLITNPETQIKVEKRLAERTWLPERAVEKNADMQDAMDFLYAYMPFGDVAEYSQELFRTNARIALQAKAEMAWGKVVPEDLFLHFVLPVRVNNENMDTSRVDFYAELKDRVTGMTMQQAILETNHWCHEKAVYAPSDSRTNSPGATVKSAIGRCGEESTFTVAALRAIGIPARQIYVPRWAHTDDNHAWVEAWADGTWYYIGACEPEPIVNKGWFDSPAKRSMLMFTKVFGHYNGAEEVISRADTFTEINVTANYAPVKSVVITINDASGNAIQNADVTFNIYNYAQQYAAVKQKSDASGNVKFTAGLGDITVWASKDGKYGFAKVDLRKEEAATIVLDKTSNDTYAYDLDIVPPIELPVDGAVTPEQRAENDRRWAIEDSIRNAYVATFYGDESANTLYKELGVDPERVAKYLKEARGNGSEIALFLSETPAEQLAVAMDLLDVISVKDLRDTPASVLRDHLNGAFPHREKLYFKEYILNPRIDSELIGNYRTALQNVNENSPLPVHGFDSLNPARVPISVLGTHNLQMADGPSFERYMIALYRSGGVAARREPLTLRPQTFDGQTWSYIQMPVDMQTIKTEQPKGTLVVTLPATKNGKPYTDDPKYYSHFSLARLDNGQFTTLDMSHSVAADMGAGISYKTLFSKPLILEEGTYQLTTGTRMADGTVLNHGEVFKISNGQTTTVPLILRQQTDKLQVIGNINPESMYIPKGSDKETSILSTTGRGYFILAMIDAKKEPTTHLLRGLESIKAELEKWNRPIVLVFGNKEREATFNVAEFPALPSTISYGADFNGKTLEMMLSMLKLPASTSWPIVVVGDSFGRVVYLSTGYNTSVSQQIKNTIDQLMK